MCFVLCALARIREIVARRQCVMDASTVTWCAFTVGTAGDTALVAPLFP